MNFLLKLFFNVYCILSVRVSVKDSFVGILWLKLIFDVYFILSV